jgi:hypothetical protein
MLAAVNNNIYKAVSPYDTFASVYSTSITADNWQATNFNSYAWLFQGTQTPLRWNGTTCVRVVDIAGFADSSDVVIGTLKPNAVHTAFGRLWVADCATNKTKVWWSDSLSGHIWNTGTAGSLDLQTVLLDGTDEIVAINSFQDNLIIFLKNNILIYSGATATPASNLALVEQIKGVGCIARDSIQNIGTDLLFLSKGGVRSLVRTLQEFNSPIRDVSKNVRDGLLYNVSLETTANIKSLYSDKEGFYLLSMPTNNKVYCFDIRSALPDGAARVTTWNNITPTAMVSIQNNDIYFGQTYKVGKYTGYLDNGSTYVLTYATPWLDYGQPYNIKILKNFYLLIESANASTFTISWATDLKETYSSTIKTTVGGDVAEYNVGEYGIAEYGYGFSIPTIFGPMSNSGKLIKMKITVPITGLFNIKKYELYSKLGRIT